MFNHLSVRLSLAFLLSAWIGIAAMALVVQRALDAGFRQYVVNRDTQSNPDQIARLEVYYADNGEWAGVDSILGGRASGNSSGGRGGNGAAGGGVGAGGAGGATLSVVDMDGIIVASTAAERDGVALAATQLETAIPLLVGGAQVGWFLRETPGIEALGAAEVAFLDEVNRWLALAGLGATVLALIVGVILAWTLANPLHELTRAARDLTVGQLGRQVEVRGTTEVHALASEFNTMSRALAEAESLRERMAADVAHELRTPVSVLRGHLEAMLDGVYPLDSAHIAVAHDQTIHLARLVEDLRVLTLAEAKRLPLERTRIEPEEFVGQLLEAFEPLALDGEIHLVRDIPPRLPDIYADATRIRQVMSNLLTNALRHTPARGEIAVRVTAENGLICFAVSNSGSSLSETEAARVFQPFWRADTARERDGSGSGLGLAISREIIALHGGSMNVESAAGRVTFTFTLPSRTSSSSLQMRPESS
ncbi:MAG: HAMP domain-containing histidine kinase [Chloroflexi bacterium]|nr:HAMP domain-containing histidine kinase [Chloroflexota bacterium]